MLFLMENKQMPWGDYGEILWSGFAPLNEENGRVCVERTGPFTPKIYLSGSEGFVFTQEARKSYESSGLVGVEFFYIMEKRKMVNVDWHNWDQTKDIEDYLEEVFEPEDIIYNGENDESLLREMPEYWLAGARSGIHLTIDHSRDDSSPSEHLFISETPEENADIYFGIERLGYFVTQRFRQWIDSNYPDHFEFFPIRQAQGV